MKNPYAVAPIDNQRKEIRLVKLEPGGPFEPIKCTLRTYVLGEDPPIYTALSYSWGPKERFNEIELNGCSFPVGRSLWSMLYRTQQQLDYKDALIWIDALCINQEDTRERNHQVQLMRQIYSNASLVWVWLGEGDNNSDLAMRYIKRREPLEHSNANFSKLWNSQKASAVMQLCERTYWTRIWIVQEVMLAKEIVVMCGDQEVPWTRIQQLIDDLQIVHDRGRAIHTPGVSAVLESQAAVIVRAKSNWDGAQDLIALLEVYRYQQASDMRDKVYGLHGLAQDTQAMAVDYHIQPKALLTKVINHICSRQKSESYTKRSTKDLYHFGKMMNEVLQTCLSERDLVFLVNMAIDAYYVQESDSQVQTTAPMNQEDLLQVEEDLVENFAYDTPGVLVCNQATESDHFQPLRALEYPSQSLITKTLQQLEPPARTSSPPPIIPFRPRLSTYMKVPLLDDYYCTRLPSPPVQFPKFECLFWYLECSYKTFSQKEWESHCQAHFRGTEPPKFFVCETCDPAKTHRFNDGQKAWEQKMKHYVDIHVTKGSRMVANGSIIPTIPFLRRQRGCMSGEAFERKFGSKWIGLLDEVADQTQWERQICVNSLALGLKDIADAMD
jgi:hypothetical protein